MNKYLMALIMFALSGFGWYLWHHKDADWFNAWCGSMMFFGMIFCGIIVLLCAPEIL
jgi:hypothetical protein